jgi:2-methylisocitrate lyase-like PEP mutase family enzyme
MPAEVAFRALRHIADSVKLPVTADLEAGYGLAPAEIVEGAVEAGACGLNIEDTDHSTGGLADAQWYADRISAIKAAAKIRKVDLVVNARIDVHIHGHPIEEGLQRAKLYLAAGADCIYPISLTDLRSISRYTTLGPTNALWRPGGPALRDIARAGVSRISVGPILSQLMLRHMRRSMDALSRLEDSGIIAG